MKKRRGLPLIYGLIGGAIFIATLWIVSPFTDEFTIQNTIATFTALIYNLLITKWYWKREDRKDHTDPH